MSFAGRDIADAGGDVVAPLLVSEDPDICEVGEPKRQGICTKITDKSLITDVSALTVVSIDGRDIVIFKEQAPYIAIKDRYVLPNPPWTFKKPDGTSAVHRLMLCNIGSNDCLDLPVNATKVIPFRGKARAKINGNTTHFSIQQDGEEKYLWYMFQVAEPATPGAIGKVEDVNPVLGDKLSVEYPVVAGGTITYQMSRELLVGQGGVELRFVPLEGQWVGYSFLLPKDYNGNVSPQADWIIHVLN